MKWHFSKNPQFVEVISLVHESCQKTPSINFQESTYTGTSQQWQGLLSINSRRYILMPSVYVKLACLFMKTSISRAISVLSLSLHAGLVGSQNVIKLWLEGIYHVTSIESSLDNNSIIFLKCIKSIKPTHQERPSFPQRRDAFRNLSAGFKLSK